MEWRRQHLPGLALPMFSCMRVGVSRCRCRCRHPCCGTHLFFFPLPRITFTTLSPSPLPPPPSLPFCPSPSSSLPSLDLCFLALAAPASADDVARLRALGDERLRPLRVLVALDRVPCMVYVERGCVVDAIDVVQVVVKRIVRGTRFGF